MPSTSYTRQNWYNRQSGGTATSADRFNDWDGNIDLAFQTIEEIKQEKLVVDLHDDYGVVGSSTAVDHTSAFVAATAEAKAKNATLWVPPLPTGQKYWIQAGNWVVDDLCTIAGERFGSRICVHPSSPPGYLLEFKQVSGTAWQNQNHLIASAIKGGLFFDGGGRVLDVGGVKISTTEWAYFGVIDTRHFKREGLLIADSTRECWFGHVFQRHCGGLANGYPSLGLLEAGTQDGINNVHLLALDILAPWGHMIHIRRGGTGNSPIRGIYIDHCQVHGADVLGPVAVEDGYDYTAQETYEFHSAHCLLVENARDVHVDNYRLNGPGRGRALVAMRQGPKGAKAINSIFLGKGSLGRSTGRDRNFFVMQDPFVGIDPVADTLTHNSTSDVWPASGFPVHIRAAGVTPGGLVQGTGTTYYIVYIDDFTAKLSDTAAHAIAGTNIVDITDTGTGNVSVYGIGFDVTRSGNVLTAPTQFYYATGAIIRLSGTIYGGLSADTDYYVIRDPNGTNSDTEISLATTKANAEAGTAIALSGATSGMFVSSRDLKIDNEWGAPSLSLGQTTLDPTNDGLDWKKDSSATMIHLTKWGGVVRDRSGILVPSRPTGWTATSALITANRVYCMRFVPEDDRMVTAIAFVVHALAANNDSCVVGIYRCQPGSPTLTNIVTSGSQAGLLNSALGRQRIPLPVPVSVIGGVPYYAAFQAAAAGAAAGVLMADMASANGAHLLPGAAIPDASAGISSPVSFGLPASVAPNPTQPRYPGMWLETTL